MGKGRKSAKKNVDKAPRGRVRHNRPRRKARGAYVGHTQSCLNCLQGPPPLERVFAEALQRAPRVRETVHPYWKCPEPLWGAAAEKMERHVAFSRRYQRLEEAVLNASAWWSMCIEEHKATMPKDWGAHARCVTPDCPDPTMHWTSEHHHLYKGAGPSYAGAYVERRALLAAGRELELQLARERREAVVKAEAARVRARVAARMVAHAARQGGVGRAAAAQAREGHEARVGMPPIKKRCADPKERLLPGGGFDAYGWPLEAEFWSSREWRVAIAAAPPVAPGRPTAQERHRLFMLYYVEYGRLGRNIPAAIPEGSGSTFV